MNTILVAGSYNESMTIVSPTLPRAGETILGGTFSTGPGGKGANQAIGTTRLDADTTFLVMLGMDSVGDHAQQLLIREGLPVAAIMRTAAAPTGVALIMVDKQGANQISVAPGANGQLTADAVPTALADSFDVLLCQLECPAELFGSLASRFPSAIKILNPAPAGALSDEVLSHVDYLTPNESELATLTSLPAGNEAEVIAASLDLIGRGVRNVVATLGSRGALWHDGKQARRYPAPMVEARDTTGAGDAFNAGFAAGLARGWDVSRSIELGVQCGSFCVTRSGVIGALPTSAELICQVGVQP